MILPDVLPEIIVLAVSTIGVPLSPSEIVALVAWTVPAIFTCEGAVIVTPPVKAVLSFASLPKVTVPVFEKVVAPAIVFDAPLNTTL